MDEIIVEQSEGILRLVLNRPARKNAMTSRMYMALADNFRQAAKDDSIKAVLWHGAGDSFCAGNDIDDFLANPPGPGDSPQSQLMHELVDFDKPIVAAVHGAAIGGGTTMLLHCDVVYAGEGTRFQMPFIDLALVPEFGSSAAMPARIGYLRAAELILLGLPFDAARAAALGLATAIIPDRTLLETARKTALKLAGKPADALRASKRLLKRSSREQLVEAMAAENVAFSAQIRSAEAKAALTAFLDKHSAAGDKATRPSTAA